MRLGWIAPALIWFLVAPTEASAARVLLLRSGDAASDTAAQRALEDRGHTVQMGPNVLDFTGTQANPAAFHVTIALFPDSGGNSPAP